MFGIFLLKNMEKRAILNQNIRSMREFVTKSIKKQIEKDEVK